MNLGLIRENITKSMVNGNIVEVKSFINTIKNDKNILEELSVYGLIESLIDNANVNMIIESLVKYDERKNKLKKIYEDYGESKNNNNALYEAINVLIENKYKKKPAIKLIEAYNVINTHINQNRNKLDIVVTESKDNNNDYKKLFPYITKSINESYKDLNENDNKVINVIINGSNEDKRFMFEEIKERSIDMIEKLSEDDMDIEMKNQTLDKINEMNCDCDEKSLEENILTLHELLDNDEEE